MSEIRFYHLLRRSLEDVLPQMLEMTLELAGAVGGCFHGLGQHSSIGDAARSRPDGQAPCNSWWRDGVLPGSLPLTTSSKRGR